MIDEFYHWQDSGLKPAVTLEAVYYSRWSGMLGAQVAIALPEQPAS